MPSETKTFYQLWCYYEGADEWVMEGLYRTIAEAEIAHTKLWNDPETLSMPDWAVVKVEGWW